jgi:tRNA-specific 2-thiouridylase
MSGGVDSSAVAALLHQQGYDVIGLTMQLYDPGLDLAKKGACCAGQDIYDAKQVADRMGFPHYVLDYESVFKASVIDDFAESYVRGETPIPCIRCNQRVKFRDLMRMARELGADCLATGHYVQRKETEHGAEMHRAIDPRKDQSYFLFTTTKEQLEYLCFPLGGLRKEETRSLARELGLNVAEKADSQDICFVPNGNYREVVKNLRPEAVLPGEILHVNGEKLGEHSGILNFTLGQRKGLGISWPTPLYVVRIEPENRAVYVGEESDLFSQEVRISELNWLGDKISEEGLHCQVKLRYAQEPVPATIFPLSDNKARVLLHQPERAITPGQACVAYDGEKLLGGGWIVRV